MTPTPLPVSQMAVGDMIAVLRAGMVEIAADATRLAAENDRLHAENRALRDVRDAAMTQTSALRRLADDWRGQAAAVEGDGDDQWHRGQAAAIRRCSDRLTNALKDGAL